MFRAYAFLAGPFNDPVTATRLTSEKFDTREDADRFLDRLLALPGVTGGDVEEHAGPFGWVVVDEVETVAILARRQDENPNPPGTTPENWKWVD